MKSAKRSIKLLTITGEITKITKENTRANAFCFLENSSVITRLIRCTAYSRKNTKFR